MRTRTYNTASGRKRIADLLRLAREGQITYRRVAAVSGLTREQAINLANLYDRALRREALARRAA